MRKNISLVLGSGGARGLAHIGAIRSLQEQGYNIRYVSGSSIGALVGGIYAAGQLDEYSRWVQALRRTDIVQLLDFGWGGSGLFKGERIIAVLRELIGEHAIEELPIGYTAVATDLHRQREVWLNRGDLFAAIRASIAIPLVFAPATLNDRLLVDGGVVNPLPIAPTLNDETDLIVAIDVNGSDEGSRELIEESPRSNAPEGRDSMTRSITRFIENIWPSTEEQRQEHGMLDVAMEAMDVMQVAIARHNLSAYSPDVTVQIPRNVARFFEFDRANELIEFGYERTEAALKKLS